MKRHLLVSAGACIISLACSIPAEAALLDRGGGLIYDEVLDITWLQDANAGAGSAYDDIYFLSGDTTDDGAMSWGNAYLWADTLSYYDPVRDMTWDDWRLPVAVQPDASCSSPSFSLGSGCTNSEMGHLFNVDGVSTAAPGPFLNIQSGQYWSGTSLILPPGAHVAVFNFDTGLQSGEDEPYTLYAWAVRDGDVGAVTIPPALYLLSSGLIGLIGTASRKRAT